MFIPDGALGRALVHAYMRNQGQGNHYVNHYVLPVVKATGKSPNGHMGTPRCQLCKFKSFALSIRVAVHSVRSIWDKNRCLGGTHRKPSKRTKRRFRPPCHVEAMPLQVPTLMTTR